MFFSFSFSEKFYGVFVYIKIERCVTDKLTIYINRALSIERFNVAGTEFVHNEFRDVPVFLLF